MSEKRSAFTSESSAEEEEKPALRYKRIRLASPSPERSEDTESIHSWQGYETEFVKDTSDTSTSPVHNSEYEVTEDSEMKKLYVSDDTNEDDNNREAHKIFNEVRCNDLGNALLGDISEENPTSTSNSDVDPGLPRCDYLDFEKCLLCHTDRKDISYPYCQKCFASRKKLFPSQPRKHQKIMKKDKPCTSGSMKDSEESSLEILPLKRSCGREIPSKRDNDSSEDKGIDDSDVGRSKPQLSQDVESFHLTSQAIKDVSSSQLSDDVERPKKCSPPSLLARSTSTSNLTSNWITLNKCRICFLKCENGLFIHTNMAHLYGCYSCTKKIWYHNGACPICRRKILKVAKLFV